MSKVQLWIRAIRPRTLPLAISSVGMGAFLAAFYKTFNAPVFYLSALTTLLLQILSNLANDYGDFKHGADSEKRQGPDRLVQSGMILPREMLLAIGIISFLALACGVILLFVSFEHLNLKALLFLLFGLASLAAAVNYTMGKNPYGYRGFGDVFVILFFGLLGVGGSFYLHSNFITYSVILPAVAFGFLSAGVLNVNNIRDIESDKEAGKFSIPVRIGRKNAVIYHWVLLVGALVMLLLFTLLNFSGYWQLLFLITTPLFFRNGIAVTTKTNARELDPYLKQLAISTTILTILFGIGLLLT